jgi:hypothetical protein
MDEQTVIEVNDIFTYSVFLQAQMKRCSLLDYMSSDGYARH